jgi:hypothetical protein
MRGKPSSEATPKMAKEATYCTREAPQKSRRNAKKNIDTQHHFQPQNSKTFLVIIMIFLLKKVDD